jgi:AraC-like DNA-binding protein
LGKPALPAVLYFDDQVESMPPDFMNAILFNFHDLLMVLTAFECLLFALLLAATNKDQRRSTWFLVGFLLCHFLIPLHELTFWGTQFRIWLLQKSPDLFFWGSYAYFIDGPLLYFFVRSLLFKDLELRQLHFLHLIPVIFYFVALVGIFYSKDYTTQYWLIESQHIAYSAPYLYFEAAGRLLRLIYAGLCFTLVLNYRRQLQHVYSTLKLSDLAWLKIMLGCFVLLFAWDVVLLSIKLFELAKNYFDLDLLNVVGLSGYYLNFAVINLLIFLRFIYFVSVPAVDEESPFEEKEERPEFDGLVDPQLIARLEKVMQEQRFYINPDITLDKLAEVVALHPRKLSIAIKLHYHLSFYEFINSYRIKEAKRLLKDPAQADKTITEIYLAVGFNSKSVFNSFFKRTEGITPSQYREGIAKPAS